MPAPRTLIIELVQPTTDDPDWTSAGDIMHTVTAQLEPLLAEFGITMTDVFYKGQRKEGLHRGSDGWY